MIEQNHFAFPLVRFGLLPYCFPGASKNKAQKRPNIFEQRLTDFKT
jgi:hypothetical protein